MIKVIQKVTRTLETLSPHLAGWWASQLFISPRTNRRRAPTINGMQQQFLKYETIHGKKGKCSVYTAGTGPTILLVHGWEGTAYSYSEMCQKLLDSGFRVILFDSPAHGQSTGKQTNIIEISQVISQLVKDEGNLSAIIGHSFGAVAIGHAIKSGLSVPRFITISAPTDMEFVVRRFCQIIKASSKTRKTIINMIENIIKDDYLSLSLTEIAREFKLPGIIIHDRRDRMVPLTHAQALSNAWPDATTLTTNGLGHNKILQDDEVIHRVVASLKDEAHLKLAA